MAGMSTFDESSVRRGQPQNKAQFRDHARTAPEVSLGADEQQPNDRPYVLGTLGGYSIKNMREHSAGMEGGGFTASLYKDGKRVLAVSNDGNGGSNRYADPKTGAYAGRSAAYVEFEAAARRIMGAEGKEYFEPDVFLDVVDFVGQVQKAAAKSTAPYAYVGAVNMPDFFDDASRAAVLHPENY